MANYKYSTNGRLVSDLFANYKTTFHALCELINNSIQARASKISLSITYETDGAVLTNTPIKHLCLWDNGIGVSEKDFKKKLMEIATDSKQGGRGIGRFAAFQLGARVKIETVAYDDKHKAFVKTVFETSKQELEKDNIQKTNVPVSHEVLKTSQDSYYQVEILEFYCQQLVRNDTKKKIHKKLLAESIEEAIFIQYPLEILNEKVAFTINGVALTINKFLIGKPDSSTFQYTDTSGTQHDVALTFIQYRSSQTKAHVFFRVNNAGIQAIGGEMDYECNIPDSCGWLIYVDSEYLNPATDLLRNLTLSSLDPEIKPFVQSLKFEIDKYFLERYKDFFDFGRQLSNDAYNPLKKKPAVSKSEEIAFTQIAYCLEKEYRILSDNQAIRRVVYPLLEKAISNRDLAEVLSLVSGLNDENINRFRELLSRCELEDIIFFTNRVAKKSEFLTLLHEMTYGEIAKLVKERKELHKFIEKNLWLFGEQYADSCILFSDKSLRNNLESLRNEILPFVPDPVAENEVKELPKDISEITDLFFFNEFTINDTSREVMVVELKSPKCKISKKELDQIDLYTFKLDRGGVFSRNLKYKVILVSAHITEYAKSKIGQGSSDPFLYFRNKEGNIESYVYQWSEIINTCRRKLAFLGNSLDTRDREIREIYETDFKDLNLKDIPSKLSKAKVK